MGGAASNGQLTLRQYATGGGGGKSYTQTGGKGGDAFSGFTFIDIANAASSATSGFSSATGRVGGKSVKFCGRGGDGSATIDLTGAKTSDGQAVGKGGTGGAGAVDGAWGDGTASARAGTSSATHTASAKAYGGTVGTGSGATGLGGAGGLAKATLAHAEGFTAGAYAGATGGKGGAGLVGASSGDGGDSTIDNAAAGKAMGGNLTLRQVARGGVRGFAHPVGTTSSGVVGRGGNARSAFSFAETTSASFTAHSRAYGGAGGGSPGTRASGGDA